MCNDVMVSKITSKLIQQKNNVSLNKYEKNLIRFHDEINDVVTERKRKVNLKQTSDISRAKVSVASVHLSGGGDRKGANSLYNTNMPLVT